MQILVTNLLPTGQLSLELVFEAGPGPHGRVLRSVLAPGGSVDISGVCTLAEAQQNQGLQDLITAGTVSISVAEESGDLVSPDSQFNKLRNDVCQAFVAAVEGGASDTSVPYHKCNPVAIGLVTVANAAGIGAAGLAAAIALVNDCRVKIVAHLESTGDVGAHMAASASSIAAPLATSQGTLDTLADELKADFNTHRAEGGGVHMVADATNNVAAGNSDGSLATAITLVNDIKAKFNLHVAATNALDSRPVGSN